MTEHGLEQEADWARAEAQAETKLLSRLMPVINRYFISGPADGRRLRRRHPGLDLEVVSNAVAFPEHERHDDDGRTLLFVGAFGYPPNSEGVRWFIEQVWPLLREERQPVRLLLAGRDMPAELAAIAKQPGIEILGSVGDIASAYARATLAIAPLHRGAGTRIKLIEAAAHGVAAVATPLAAQGLSFSSAMWLAREPAEFAEAIRMALADPADRDRRTTLARKLARASYDRSQVVDHLACSFADLLARSP